MIRPAPATLPQTTTGAERAGTGAKRQTGATAWRSVGEIGWGWCSGVRGGQGPSGRDLRMAGAGHQGSGPGRRPLRGGLIAAGAGAGRDRGRVSPGAGPDPIPDRTPTRTLQARCDPGVGPLAPYLTGCGQEADTAGAFYPEAGAGAIPDPPTLNPMPHPQRTPRPGRGRRPRRRSLATADPSPPRCRKPPGRPGW